ncbi:PrsW family glutamic-type intramembrane protease [Herbiconiux sp. L3-i23]|uniref:PrsW family glutamic-type intramembrane protease n=1 Tax=Herbiconiux sp. L3-i23 TaxID=2905871 RepID=UPI002070CFD5|nr:PrsW family glutamic-type intramembrane protease [Herbiconiux sp. L3-i23]BDI23712.1 hypothetical protein L3i23_24880 [Herbiconiux sp. L3-i23]
MSTTLSEETQEHPTGDAAGTQHQTRADKRAAKKANGKHHTGRYFLLGLGIWLVLGLFVVVGLQNHIVMASWAVMGAFLVPGTLVWAMAGRLRPDDSITVTDLFKFMLFGGLLAVSIGSTIDSIIGWLAPGANGEPSMISYALSGIAEEFAKAIIVVVLARKMIKSVRNGLFLGGALGAGFAGFETLGYIIWEPIRTGQFDGGHPTQLEAFVSLLRGVIAPIGHPLWTALLVAAIFAAAAAHNNRYRFTLGVLGAYLAVALVHGLNDVGQTFVEEALGNGTLTNWAGDVYSVVLAIPVVLVWRHIARTHGAAKQELPVTA